MRFKEYITEMEEVKFIKKMIDSKSKQLYNILSSYDWVITNEDLIKHLNKIFKDYNITFSIGTRKLKMYETIIEAEIDTDSFKVDIMLPSNISSFFRRFAKPDKKNIFMDIRKNQFFSELLNSLSHEYRHFMQAVSFPEVDFSYDESDEDYLSDKSEMDAFALQAALEFLKIKKPGGIMNTYKNKFSVDNSKIYKSFIKKVERYKVKLKQLNIDKVF